jgi:hypothetical protein
MGDSPITDESGKEIIKQIVERETIIQKEKESERERESGRESGRERDGERESGRERDGERESGRERERESGRESGRELKKGNEEVSKNDDEQTDKQRMLKALEDVDKERLKDIITSSIKEDETIDDKTIDDKTIDDINISIEEDDESQVNKLERCSSLKSPQQSQESQPQSQPQSLASQHTLDADNHPVISREDPKLDRDCLDMLDDLYLNCQKNLKIFFDNNIVKINDELNKKKININNFLQIKINTRALDKFILEINICRYDSTGMNIIILFECAHISLFTKRESGGIRNIRGLHFTLPKYIINNSNKRYSHLYIGHIVAETSLGAADAANKFIRIVLNSMGTYFETQMSISNPGEPAKSRVINFIKDLKLTSDERIAIGKLLKYIGAEYKGHFKTPAATSGGGMKIMKYNKIVEKNNRKINNKDGKNTLVNDKELKINKIKDKIKILKQDKIKNKDKIIKQIKLIEDIKTKIKIEKERAKQKHQEKTSVSKTPKTTTAKPKTTTAKPKTTTAKPKTTTAKPKTTTAKPKTTTAKPKTTTAKPKTTTAKPKTTTAKPKTTTAKPKTTTAKPKTTTAKPKTTTAKPKTPKRQANKGVL